MGCATCGALAGQGYAWKTTGCDEVFIFLPGDHRTASCAGAGRKACPAPAHPGCRPYCYSHPACRPYRYSQSNPVGAASPAASPCIDANTGRSRTHRAGEDTGSDKRLISVFTTILRASSLSCLPAPIPRRRSSSCSARCAEAITKISRR
jgi:hypothetical protein